MNTCFHYLATPYTDYHLGREEAFKAACRLAARLMESGIAVYSPIAHSHPIARHGGLDETDHELWMRMDEPMMHAACGLFVGRLKGWVKSKGVRHEIEVFREAGKRVIYIDP